MPFAAVPPSGHYGRGCLPRRCARRTASAGRPLLDREHGRWSLASLGGPLRAVADSLGLALRGLWWRKGVSIAVLLVAATTVLAAAIGPLYARAGSESILQDTLRSAKTGDIGMEIYQNQALSATPLQNLDAAIAGLGRLTGYAKPIHSLQYTGFLPGRPGQVGPQAMLAYREGACAHLILAAGRCPQRVGEVAVSRRSVPEYPFGLGARLDLNGFTDSQSGGVPALRVVGLYVPKDRNDPFWFDQNYFSASVTTCDCPNMGDTLFTPKATFDVASPPEVRAVVDLPLDVRSTRLRDTGQLRKQLVELRANLADSGAGTFSVLDKVLDSAKESSRRLGVSVALVTAQLLLLSWFVLYLVVANASESRGPEVALAKLRGLTPARTVAFGLLEPGLVLLLATPIGLLVGVAAAVGLGRLRLLAGTPVAMTSATLLATAGALAGAAVAAVLAARGTLRRPVVEQWRRTVGERRSPGALRHADLVLVVLAVVGLASLRLGALGKGRTGAPVLLAPALVALALALLGVRLLPIAARAAVRRSRGSSRVGSFVALRQVSRRPSGLRIVVLLAVAFALTTFTVAAWSVSSSNRSARAATEVGASTVLTVDPGRVNLVDAVRRLDPTGKHAMAAAEYFPFSNEPGGRLVAVDATRLAAVATWRPDFAAEPLRELSGALHPTTAPGVVVTGTQLALTVTASDLTGGGTAELQADVRSPTTGGASVLLGRIRPGRQVYVGAIPTCAAGCELTGFGVPNGLAEFSPRSGRLLFTALAARPSAAAAWTAVGAGFATPGRWTGYRLSAPAKANRVEASPAGLRLTYAGEFADVPGVSPFDAPSVLPAVVAGTAVDNPVVGRPTTVTGLDGNKLPVRIAATALVLPRAGGTGTMLDLEYADRALGTAAYLATRQVWLTADAPADFAARLHSAGVDVLGRTTAAERRAVLARQAPALALLLFLCAATLAALLAAGATIVSIYLAGRRRSFELAAMRAVGVRRSQLLRACIGEQLLLLLSGVGLGTLAGLLGAALALRSMPIYSDDVAVPPVHYLPSPVPVGAVLIGAATLIALAGALAAVLLVRSARPARLREVQA